MPGTDDRIASLASSQHGVVARRQLLAAGISRSQIAWRLRHGRLHLLHPGVYAVGHRAVSDHARWMAAVLAVGRDAALTGRVAAAWWGMWRGRPGRTIGVVTTARRVAGADGMRLVATRSLPASDVVTVDALRVTTPARTVVELAATCDAYRVANIMHEAAYRGILDLDQLSGALDRTRHRPDGTHAVISRALAMHLAGSAGTRSGLESRLLRAIEAAGLPHPHVNVRLRVAAGAIEVDFCWPLQRLCVEVDGVGHRRPRSRRADRARDRLLRAAGYHVVRIPGTVIEDSTEVAVGLVADALLQIGLA